MGCQVIEIIALIIVCKNIGAMARAGGVTPRPFQVRAVVLWLVFEFGFMFVAVACGAETGAAYLLAVAGALISLVFSFRAVQSEIFKRSFYRINKPANLPTEGTP